MSPGPGERDRSWGAVGVSLLTGAFVLSLLTVVGADLMWLVALGDDVRSTGALPDGVPFAAAPSEGWPPVLLAAEVILSVVHEPGLPGLMIWHYLAVLGALAILAVDARRRGATGPGDRPRARSAAPRWGGHVRRRAPPDVLADSLRADTAVGQGAAPTTGTCHVVGASAGRGLGQPARLGAPGRLRDRRPPACSRDCPVAPSRRWRSDSPRSPRCSSPRRRGARREYYAGVLQNEAAAQGEGLWAAPSPETRSTW